MFYMKPEDMKDIDMTAVIDDQNFIADWYKNSAFIKELERYLPKLMHEGYLD